MTLNLYVDLMNFTTESILLDYATYEWGNVTGTTFSLISSKTTTTTTTTTNTARITETDTTTTTTDIGSQNGLAISASSPPLQSAASSPAAMGQIQIGLYATIFLLAIVGNILVILTLVQNRRMRTITNVFLLNLAVSDLLLGMLCIPFTLVGAMLRNFIFGEFMCKILPYLQACSVSVSAWTLVAISCERYYAICHPLRSRTWQTLKHAYKLIALIWICSLMFMVPIAVLSKLIPIGKGHHKCREYWPPSVKQYEKAYNIFLDLILLIIPVVVLTATYSLISRTLWHGMRAEKVAKSTQSNNLMEVFINKNGSPSNRSFMSYRTTSRDNLANYTQYANNCVQTPTTFKEFSYSTRRKQGLRRTNIEKSLQNKKRVIKMLFMVVLEFFICWTPLYTINTISMFSPSLVYQNLGYSGVIFFQLLAYSSSCCNPITYCFMNRGFRKAFLNLFRCFKRFRSPKRKISIGDVATQDTDLEISKFQFQQICNDSTLSY
ncbi:cholecystokinin receptor type A isoform X2 [Eupeodes corollae]|uniref:cholecystokinin receptor type A isoform X2 n=1 Tax=Eupeodes corollae TaxID=290404 RepID=UPI002493445D|nr:cholecystokinin receptor type A isoform X2 [Eupeodes corollae]